MKKLWPALICLSACALSSCVPGKVNNSARDDGYVFYIGSWRYTSKGKQLGCAIPEIELNGERVKIVRTPYAAYCADGAIYAVCETKVEGVHFLCYCRAGETIGIVLAQAPSYSISLPTGRNIYTKNVQVEFGDGKRRFLRDGEIVEIDEGTLVCPEGDGRVVEKDGAAFYAEGDQRWEFPRPWGSNIVLNGWMVYCQTSRGYASFDMRSKELTETTGEYRGVMGLPFFVKETKEEDVFCYMDDKGQVEERPLGVLLRRDPYRAGGDSVFRFGAMSASEYVYDYAFDKLTHCVEGQPSVYEGDFSFYEDDNYRFHVKMTYEPDGYTGPNYYRLDKKTDKDEFLYRRKSYNPTVRGDTTVFPEVGWAIAPAN